MTFTEAAAEVLRLAGKPLHYKEITEIAIEQNLLSHVGKSPEVTMGARLAALLKKDDKATTIVRVKPGIFALRDLDDKKSKPKIEKTPEPEPEHAGTEVNALEVEAASREPAPQPPLAPDRATTPFLEEEPPVVSGEDALRADLAARGAELFDDEDDDDQPILAPPASPNPQDALPSEGRRRRRRRRRGRGPSNGEAAELRPDVPPPPSPPTLSAAVESGAERTNQTLLLHPPTRHTSTGAVCACVFGGAPQPSLSPRERRERV